MEIILIGEDGKRVEGNITLDQAKIMARDLDKVLVLKDDKHNVYRIVDRGRLKYESAQKERDQRAQQRAQKIKEIKFTPLIENHDLEIKLNHIREFLTKGLRTKITMTFKGRQVAFKDDGMEKIAGIISKLDQEGLATAEKPPKFDGRNIIVLLIPKK